MSDATDLLASINQYPYDASTNPGGLADSGYLQEVGGVSLVARAVRAMGTATDESDVSFDLGTAVTDAQASLAQAAGYLADAETAADDTVTEQARAEAAEGAAGVARDAAYAAASEIAQTAFRWI